MTWYRSFTVLALAMALCGTVKAQESPAQLSPALRLQVYELLSYQCGAAEVEDRFRLAVSELGPVTEAVFLSVLTEGVPAEIRASRAAHAVIRYDRRQAWLAENGKALFGEDAERLVKRSREDDVAESMRRLDALYRENAVRGLGIVGGTNAAEALRAAATSDPDLTGLAERALDEIRQRR